MQTLIFRKEPCEALPQQDDIHICTLEQQRAFYEKFGMQADARDAQKALEKLAGHSPELFYPRITSEEWIVWQWFLPVYYTATRPDYPKTHAKPIETAEELPCEWTRGYSKAPRDFSIPVPILKEFEFCLTLHLFSAYTVHMPYSDDPILVGYWDDPILVGHWHDERFLLGRWGEALENFAAIQQRYAQRNRLSQRLKQWFRSF